MILLIDNYDSFVYNLAQVFGSLGCDMTVARNDQIDPAQALALEPEGIVLSPGPRGPADAGQSVELIRHAAGRVPILGVCLGHQCIAVAFGGSIVRSGQPTHGKSSPVTLDRLGLLADLPEQIDAARYHSLTVSEATLPDSLLVTARTGDGEIMGLRHREFPIEGVQFHPESYLTPDGPTLLKNFVQLSQKYKETRRADLN